MVLLLLANKQKGTLRFVLLLSPWLPFHSWVPHRLLTGDPICRLFPKVYPPKSRGWRPCGAYISEPVHLSYGCGIEIPIRIGDEAVYAPHATLASPKRPPG